MFATRLLTVATTTLLALAGCGSSESPAPTSEGAPTTEAPVPPPPPAAPTPESARAAGLEALPASSANMEKALLGRRLFHDGRLSGDGTISCSSCHSLDHGGAEARATSVGIGGHVGPINAPTVLNSSLNFVQFWDGRAPNLVEQARGPVTNPGEMGSDFARVVANVSGDPAYVSAFAASYPDGITENNIVDAIAEYETSLLTPSRFDRWMGGDATALSADEQAGLGLFTSVGCTTCHRGAGVGGTMYQRMGLVRDYFAERGTPLTDADNGRFNVTHDEGDRRMFKVPLLRNVALTGPYFHDGSRETLDDAVRTMGRYQLGRELEAEQVRLLVAFLNSLTGELPAHARMPVDAGAPADPTAPPPAPGAAPLEALPPGVGATPGAPSIGSFGTVGS